MAIKALIIEPALPYDSSIFDHEVPVHLVYLANFLMEKIEPKPSIEFLDVEQERKNGVSFDPFNTMQIEALVKNTIDQAFEVRREDRLFVLVSCFFTYQYLSSRVLLRAIQNLRESRSIDVFKVIVGGYHPTVLPGDFEGLGVDYVVRGEGELALLDLMAREGKSGPHTEVIEGNIVRDLDVLPATDFSVYRKYLPLYKHLAIALSRGCPFSCNFCVEKKYKAFKCDKAAWRAYSPNRAIKEVEAVIKASETMLKGGGDGAVGFYDPIFGLNDRWLQVVLDFLHKENHGYRFYAETRIDGLRPENLRALKAANVSLMLGLESGSPAMLMLMNKAKDPAGFLGRLEGILTSAKRIGYGPFVLNLMFNFPGETPGTLDETFAYLERLVAAGGNFAAGSNFYTFFPGDAVFSDTGAWERKCGTRIHFKEWWKSQKTATAGHILDASHGLTIRDCISRVHDGMIGFLEHAMDNESNYAKKLLIAKKLAIEGRTLKKWLVTIDGLPGAPALGQSVR
ncbi:MAG: cobalamin-dependent protein [Candidatus Lokiarchaeota archaeon]|nr:cobalamin-dependent protein [Candidatus Lokiarchaeota archaeon]